MLGAGRGSGCAGGGDPITHQGTLPHPAGAPPGVNRGSRGAAPPITGGLGGGSPQNPRGYWGGGPGGGPPIPTWSMGRPGGLHLVTSGEARAPGVGHPLLQGPNGGTGGSPSSRGRGGCLGWGHPPHPGGELGCPAGCPPPRRSRGVQAGPFILGEPPHHLRKVQVGTLVGAPATLGAPWVPPLVCGRSRAPWRVLLPPLGCPGSSTPPPPRRPASAGHHRSTVGDALVPHQPPASPPTPLTAHRPRPRRRPRRPPARSGPWSCRAAP